MTAPTDIFANVSRGLRMQPDGAIAGRTPNALSSALWIAPRPAAHELVAEPIVDSHLLALIHSPMRGNTYVDGKLTYGGEHPIGTVTFIRAGSRPRAVIRDAFRIQHIYMPTALLADVLVREGRTVDSLELIEPQGVQDQAVFQIGKAMIAEMEGGDRLTPLRIDTLGLELAIHFLRNHSNYAQLQLAAIGGLAGWRLRRVCDRMTDDLTDEPSLAELAALVDMSPAHFCRVFRRSTGLPPHRWLARHRLEQASALLAGSDLPLADVAASVGYYDASYFARVFKRATGTTPLLYRRSFQ